MSNDVLSHQFKSTPYWWEAAPPEKDTSTTLKDRYDAIIVGSGFTGLCCAIELAENNFDVLVVDAGDLSIGGSSRSGGMVTGGQKFIVSQSIKGVDDGRRDRILEDARESLILLEERIRKYELDADYQRCGRIILASLPSHMQKLTSWKGLFEKQGKNDVELLSREQLSNELSGNRYHGGLLIKDYGGIHPAKYSKALRQTAERLGVTLLSHAAVTKILKGANGYSVVTKKGAFASKEVFVGTNGYTTGDALPYLKRRLVPVNAYVVATEVLPDGMMERILPQKRMLSDTQKNLIWMRPTPDGKRMILGSRPSPFEIDERSAARIMHRQLCAIWPELEPVKIEFCWTGFVGMTPDRIPHMGTAEGIHYAIGCNGSGVAMMSYLGFQSARKILGRQNRPCAFEGGAFDAAPLYNGTPWFVPIVTTWYNVQDKFAAMTDR